MVEPTHLKDIGQIGSFPQVEVEKKTYLKAAATSSELYFGHFGERDSLILNHRGEDQPLVNGCWFFHPQ